MRRPLPQPSSDAPSAALVARFQSAVDAERARYSVPGITAAFVLSDGRVAKVASGFADVERKVRHDARLAHARRQYGQDSGGCGGREVVEQRVWSLDDKVSKYLGKRPWFQRLPNADALTIRLLLQHRSGLENYYNNPRFLDWYRERMAEDPSFVPGFDTLIEFVCDRPPLFAPGQGFNYSDIGYLLVGLAIESATGRTYYDLAREFYLIALALMLTVPANTRKIPGLAQGYANARNPIAARADHAGCERRTEYDPSIEFTAGGFATNAGDLARWAFALYGGRALDAAAVSEMVAVPLRSDRLHATTGSARVFSRRQMALPFAYGHDGYIPGYRSSLRYYPAAAVAIALQANTEDGFWEEGKESAQPVTWIFRRAHAAQPARAQVAGRGSLICPKDSN